MAMEAMTVHMPMVIQSMQAMLSLAVTDRQAGTPRLQPMMRLLCAMVITAPLGVQMLGGLKPSLAR